jgi:ferredoxin-NADP reductase
VIYRDELQELGADVVQTLTREQPAGWSGYARRVDIDMLREVVYPPEQDPRVFVCGPTSFVEAVAEGLVALGHRPGRIRTERFGGT